MGLQNKPKDVSHMRPQSNGLTTAEWYLMESLWEHSPKTGREIIEDMKLRQNWNRSTTLTMLRRMTEKEQIECREEDGIRVYVHLFLLNSQINFHIMLRILALI